jgi:hypothetical protein
MTLMISPDFGVPMTDELPKDRLRERLRAAAATTELLADHGLEVEPTQKDIDICNELAASFAADPERLTSAMGHKEISQLPPPVVMQVNAILSEFSHAVVQNAVQIRQLVTNKLIMESVHPDPRIRLRAMEMLGKISDVGLFTERSEVTINHQSNDELKNRLRSKMQKLRQRLVLGRDGIYSPEVPIDGDVIDVDAEMGVHDSAA